MSGGTFVLPLLLAGLGCSSPSDLASPSLCRTSVDCGALVTDAGTVHCDPSGEYANPGVDYSKVPHGCYVLTAAADAGDLPCPPGWGQCGDAGVCDTNLEVDPNCGACGNDCASMGLICTSTSYVIIDMCCMPSKDGQCAFHPQMP